MSKSYLIETQRNSATRATTVRVYELGVMMADQKLVFEGPKDVTLATILAQPPSIDPLYFTVS